MAMGTSENNIVWQDAMQSEARVSCPVASKLAEDEENSKPRIKNTLGSCGLFEHFHTYDLIMKNKKKEYGEGLNNWVDVEDETPKHRWMFYGTKEINARASLVYLLIGLPVLVTSVSGFLPVIYWRISTGRWWRDPVLFRQVPMPDAVDMSLNIHGVLGMVWSSIAGLQLLTGALCARDASGSVSQLRALHRFVGQRSFAVTVLFFMTCAWTWFKSSLAEPIGEGFNSVFVRVVQATCGNVSFLLYFGGMYAAYRRRFALHKDLLIGSILFATVPIGVPRFGRDVVQLYIGEACNMSLKPEFNFFVTCLFCIVGWPVFFILSRRFMPEMKFWLVANIVIVAIFCLITRPNLHMNPCFFGLNTDVTV